MKIERVWAMPNKDTFDAKPIRELVQNYLRVSKTSIDPFARNKSWATYTNDLNPETSAQYHMEAAEFLSSLVSQEVKVDLILFDPPYSLEQCVRSYAGVGRQVTQRDTQVWGRWTEHKDLCNKLLLPEGKFLYFGWNSNGMGKKRGFEIEEILLVAHGSAHPDNYCYLRTAGRFLV
jgi:hypothetical protein